MLLLWILLWMAKLIDFEVSVDFIWFRIALSCGVLNIKTGFKTASQVRHICNPWKFLVFNKNSEQVLKPLFRERVRHWMDKTWWCQLSQSRIIFPSFIVANQHLPQDFPPVYTIFDFCEMVRNSRILFYNQPCALNMSRKFRFKRSSHF